MIATQNPSPMPIPIPYNNPNESLYYQLHHPYPLLSPPLPTSSRITHHHHTYSVPTLLPPFALSLNTPPSTPSKKSHKRNHKSTSSPSKQHKRRSNSEFEMTMALDLSDLSTPSSTPSPPMTPVTPSFAASTPPPSFPVRGYSSYGHGRSPSLPTFSSASSSFSSTSSGSGSSFGDRYANSTFQNSPPPSGLPKPRFLSE